MRGYEVAGSVRFVKTALGGSSAESARIEALVTLKEKTTQTH